MEMKTTERLHSGYSIASLVIGCFTGSFFLWLIQLLFYKVNAVVIAFAGQYVLRDIIASSIEGSFIFLAIIGLVLGIIGIKRKRTSLSLWAIILNVIVILVGSFRLFILLMVMFVF